MINKFCQGINISNTGQERDVIMEPCLRDERENMDTSGNLSFIYLYIHLSIIYELGSWFPFLILKQIS